MIHSPCAPNYSNSAAAMPVSSPPNKLGYACCTTHTPARPDHTSAARDRARVPPALRRAPVPPSLAPPRRLFASTIARQAKAVGHNGRVRRRATIDNAGRRVLGVLRTQKHAHARGFPRSCSCCSRGIRIRRGAHGRVGRSHGGAASRSEGTASQGSVYSEVTREGRVARRRCVKE
ncbi:hypothetical protein VTO73DRAFT_11307 [Trametes versicolor]